MPTKSRALQCKCGKLLYNDNLTGLCQKCRHTPPITPIEVTADRERKQRQAQLRELESRYNQALNTIEHLENALAVRTALDEGLETCTIAPRQGHSGTEGTVVLVASDWHSEERVLPGQVGGLNEHNLGIGIERAERFFQSGLRLVQILQQDIKIPTIILPLLGDFITGQIHGAANAETNELQPIHAIVRAQNLLISGIEFLLEHSDCELVLPCHSGNHARTTERTRFGSEEGHSLEYLMYLHLRAHFRSEPRVTCIIPEGYHSYVDVYGHTLRFHHGHAIKYQGGIGGLFIPAYKAIAQWNKARPAHLDIFGHFHQTKDGGNFLCNGSLIGYNAFAVSIKADYEPPKQLLCLIDNKRGRTCVWPVFV